MKEFAGKFIVVFACFGFFCFHLIAGAEDQEDDALWKNEISLGATLNKGNSDAISIHLELKSVCDRHPHKLDFSAFNDYGESDGNKNIEKAGGQLEYEYAFYEKLYWQIVASADHDDMANLDYRLIISPGLGCKIISSPHVILNMTLGPAYMREQFHVSPDDYAERSTKNISDVMGVRLSETFEYKLSETAKLTQKFSALSDVSSAENFILRGEISAQSQLTEKTSMRIKLKNDFVNAPPSETKRNDLSLIASLIMKF